jgi:hypothetical protein
MKIYLVDGTYELFRNHFGPPPRKGPDGREVGATLGLLRRHHADNCVKSFAPKQSD